MQIYSMMFDFLFAFFFSILHKIRGNFDYELRFRSNDSKSQEQLSS